MSILEGDSGPGLGATAPFDVVRVGSVPFQVTSLDSAAEWLVDVAAREKIPVNVRLANAYNVALADEDPGYAELLATRGINFPDGAPVVWFMNLRRRQAAAAAQVRGPSLFNETLRRGQPTGVKHYLLGAMPSTLDALTSAIADRYPEARIAGTYSPPFAPVTEDFIDDCAEAVRDSGADLVWLGLGTPKQDLLGSALSERLGLTTVNVGAAFDFVAGTVREAPVWLRGSGLEWTYRLAAEPRRLWRRYLFGNTRFVAVATAGRIRNVTARSRSEAPFGERDANGRGGRDVTRTPAA